MDTCHSGSIFDLAWNLVVSDSTLILAKEGNYNQTEGLIVLLSGSKDYQTSSDTVDNRGIPSGALTNALFEAFQTSGYQLPCDILLTKIQNLVAKSYQQTPCMSFGQYVSVKTIFPI